MRLVVFCEAVADFRIASELVDRVLRHDGPGWVADLLDAAPDGLRSWRGDGRGNPFFDLHHLAKHVEQLAIRVPHGRFDGRRGAADAVMARTALSIVRYLARRGEIIDAVLVGRRSNAAQIVDGYLTRIVNDYLATASARRPGGAPPVRVVARNWFNPNLEFQWFTVPGLIGVIALLIAAVTLTAATVLFRRRME